MLTPSRKGSATTSTRLSLITNWLNSRMASAMSSLTGPGEYTLPCSMMATGLLAEQLNDHRAVGHRQPAVLPGSSEGLLHCHAKAGSCWPAAVHADGLRASTVKMLLLLTRRCSPDTIKGNVASSVTAQAVGRGQ